MQMGALGARIFPKMGLGACYGACYERAIARHDLWDVHMHVCTCTNMHIQVVKVIEQVIPELMCFFLCNFIRNFTRYAILNFGPKNGTTCGSTFIKPVSWITSEP